MQSSGYDPYLTTGQDKAIILDLIIPELPRGRARMGGFPCFNIW